VSIEVGLNVAFFAGFRQIAVILMFVLIWLWRPGKKVMSKKYILSVVLLSVILIVGAAITGVPFFNVVVGTFMTIEFALIFYFASSTRITPHELMNFSRIFLIFLMINMIFAVVGYVDKFPEAMRHDVGVQGDAGFFASGLNIGVILLLGLSVWKKNIAYIIIAAIFSIVIALTVIKKAVFINIIIWLLWSYFLVGKGVAKRIIPIVAILLIANVLAIGGFRDNLSENLNYLNDVGYEEHVRFVMYLSGFNIALDNFPFGSGAGTFGSLASITNYFSPIYDLHGVSAVPTNSLSAVENGTHTILDTYWPHIIGEAGFVGFFIVISIFLIPIKQSITVLSRHDLQAEIKFAAFVALCIPLSLIIEGFALYTPESPSFLIFLGGVSGYCYRIIKIKVKKNLSPGTEGVCVGLRQIK
jgi:hypothetical protein